MFKAIGIALLVLALAIGIVPQYTDCLSQGHTVTLASGATQPMKCHWSAEAEIGVAIPLGISGLLMILSRKKESIRNLSLLAIVLGAMTMLIPSEFIGVCGNPTHICASTMKPLLLSFGGVVTAISIFSLVMSLRIKEEQP